MAAGTIGSGDVTISCVHPLHSPELLSSAWILLLWVSGCFPAGERDFMLTLVIHKEAHWKPRYLKIYSDRLGFGYTPHPYTHQCGCGKIHQ